MNKHPKKSLFTVSALFLVFILLALPTSQAFSQSSGLTIIRPLLAEAVMEVMWNTVLIVDNDLSPSLADGTDFGSTAVADGTVSHDFTIHNAGDATLTLGTISSSNTDDFTVTQPLESSLAPGESTTFTVVFNPSVAGLCSADLTITNDSVVSEYNFRVQGTGETPPGAFNKLLPVDGQNPASLTPTLSWETSLGADYYEYCYDTTNDTTCDPWINNGINTSVTLPSLTASTNYYWQVRAWNDLGPTYANDTTLDYWVFVVGAAPGNFFKSEPMIGAENQATSLTLSWTESLDADGYAFCYDQSDDGICAGWVNVGMGTSAPINGLTPGGIYYWQVKAMNTYGETLADGGTYWLFTVGTLPAAFSKVNPANGAVNQLTSVTLSWGTSSGATNYEYCYYTSPATSCSSWADVDLATNASLSGLTYGATYYWQVRATNDVGTTYANDGTYWSFTVGTLPGTFGKVSPLNAATGQLTSLTLDWGDSNGATSYAYCYSLTTGCTDWVSTGLLTNAAISGLSYGATYYWQVRASNTLGDTLADGGVYWSFTVGTLPGTFGKVSPLNAATGQLTSLTLNWGDSIEATGYAYCYALTTGCTNWVSTGLLTNAAISGLSYGTTYYWQVRASNTLGDTLANDGTYWSFTVGTLPGTFSKVSPLNAATGQLTSLTLDWGDSNGATGYAYCYSLTTGCTNWVSTGLLTNAAISGLSYGTTYYWQVRASNTLGDTLADGGTYWSFTTAFPEMDVRGNGLSITDGDNSPSPTDGTDFGSAAVLDAIVLHTFTIHNTGLGDLILTGSPRVAISGTAAADFTVSVLPSSVVVPGGSTSFIVVFNPSASGLRSAALSIANNDSNENPYNFNIQGTGIAAPEMEVRYSTLQIYDGDPTPSEYDGTDFGALPVASGTVTHTFTINNLGDATLNLTGNPRVAVSGDNAADFSVTVLPSSSVAPGGSTTFTVVFNPSASGLRSAALSIANNDANENPYNFNIQGTGVNPPAAFTKLAPANGATEVSTSPVLSWSASTQVSRYEYCIDQTPDNACSTWINNGTSTSVGLSGLSSVATYYWHVRAVNIAGTTYADGSVTAFWYFTTTWAVSPDFYKNTPLDNAVDQPVDLTLSWGESVGASSYEYCIDTDDDDACTNWINVGNTLSVALTGLREETIYYWQVRANNSGQVIYAGGSATAFWGFTTGDFFTQEYLPLVRK